MFQLDPARKILRTSMLPQTARLGIGIQLQISARRLLLMMGDALAIVTSVLISLRLWACKARNPFDLGFVLRHQSLALDLLIALRTSGKMLAFQGT